MNLMNLTGAVIASTLAVGLSLSPSLSGNLEDSLSSVYRLYSGDRQICSAVAVENGVFLTAAHCVSEDMNIQVPFYDSSFEVAYKEVYYVESLEVNPDNDVAVLKTIMVPEEGKIKTTDLCNTDDFRIGTPLFAIGYPKGYELTFTEGMFTARTKLPSLDMDGIFYKTTIPITGGSSGGGLFQQGWSPEGGVEYCLSGLATAAWSDVSFMSYFSTLPSLREILE